MDIINDNLLSQENIEELIQQIECGMYVAVPIYEPGMNPYKPKMENVKRTPTAIESSVLLILKHLKSEVQ